MFNSSMGHMGMPLMVELIIKFNLHYTTMVVFISLMVMIFVKVYLDQKTFISILSIFVCSMIMLLNSGNSFIMMMLGWDMLGLTSLLLVLFYNSTYVNSSAFYIMLVNSFSDSLFIIMILMYSTSSKLQTFSLLMLIITIISMTKSAIWPIHYWLPMAMDAPTPVSCLLHSSTLVVAGFYLYTELLSMCNNMALLWLSFVSYLMSLNYMWCCEDIKKFIAYSTMMNMSIIMMYASSMYSEMSYMHVLSHSLYKSVLFLMAGYLLMYNSGNQDMRSMSMPMTLVLVLVLMMSNLGIFFVFTMSTEHLFKMLTMPVHMLIVPMLTLSVFFVIKIMMKLLEALGSESKSYVLMNKLSSSYYTLLLPLMICLCGDKYFMKVQPMVAYESSYCDMLFIMMMFVIPMNKMHKSEINNLSPMRLDQELMTESYIDVLKSIKLVRYNAIML